MENEKHKEQMFVLVQLLSDFSCLTLASPTTIWIEATQQHQRKNINAKNNKEKTAERR